MSINNRIVQRTDALYADEFERALAHRSSTVQLFWTSYASIGLAPIMAWYIDGPAAILSFLPLLPPVIGGAIGSQWLRKRVPAPAKSGLKDVFPIEWAWTVAVIVAWIAGLSHSQGEDFSIGSIVGAVMGAVLVAYFAPKLAKHRHEKDVARLNAELDD